MAVHFHWICEVPYNAIKRIVTLAVPQEATLRDTRGRYVVHDTIHSVKTTTSFSGKSTIKIVNCSPTTILNTPFLHRGHHTNTCAEVFSTWLSLHGQCHNFNRMRIVLCCATLSYDTMRCFKGLIERKLRDHFNWENLENFHSCGF